MNLEFKKLNNIIGWLVWCVATFTFCSTIEPTASFWDCGEYISCADKLQVGHPPGAPTFLILGRLFALFAGSNQANVAMMINVLSALASSFGVMFLFWSITKLGLRTFRKKASELPKPQQWAILGAGLVGSLACTFSDTFWFNAVEGEVYALASFFTSIVFWSILKWDEEDTINPVGALRWLVLISFLIGMSIGVHLLVLLTIPAICLIIYFKKYKFTVKGFIYACIVAIISLGSVQNIIIPKVVKFVSDYEVFFTNKLHLAFSSGTFLFFLLLIVLLCSFIIYTFNKQEKYFKIGFYTAIAFSAIAAISAPSAGGVFTRLITLGGILYFINKYKTETIKLNTVFLSLTTLLIGYSTFFVLVIRSQANTPMDENDPENAPNLLSYLLREQYGDWPLIYGQYYNAPPLPREEYGDGDPIYAKDKANNRYKVIDSRKKSIPKYQKEFCTIFPRMHSSQSHHVSGYRYWGKVDEYHKNKIMERADGQTETEQIPTFMANITFFFRYQINYMYLRYFYWNFVGRQNDVQGSTGNNLDGNWITGITGLDSFVLDYDTSKPIYRDRKNLGANHFYALPLILGLLGVFFHFKRNKHEAWIVLSLFLFTGLAIIVFLNQSPYQVRERDYAYIGSFYAFSIWIGFGVLFIYDFLSKKGAGIGISIGSTALGLIIPALMAKGGWDDHDRSLRTLSRDSAIDYLESCAPNAILFTNGDNDTFPLWYAQEVEGVRTDVRVVNLSLLQTDWYIKQMRRAAYESMPVPFTIPEERLEAEKLSYLLLDRTSSRPMNVKDALVYALDTNNRYNNHGDMLDIFPTDKLYLDVDSATVVNNNVIDKKDIGRLEKRISWDLGNRNYILKNDLMVLDLIAHNNWKRPIYFAVTTGNEAYIGLEKYFQLEGLAYRFVPVKQSQDEDAVGGRVKTEVMYNNVMNKFSFGGANKPGVSLDENCYRITGNLRVQMGILAAALIREGKLDKAKNVLDKCMKEMPEENVPYDATMFGICRAYYEIKDYKNANALAKALFDMYENDLKVYNSMKAIRRAAYTRDIGQAKEILKMLISLTQQFGQDEPYKEFIGRIPGVLSKEDMEPATPANP